MPAGFARENEFDGLLQQQGAARGVDWLLLKAIVATESGFRPEAVRVEPAHNDGSYGLMQILSATARGLGYAGQAEGLFDPATNIEWGTAYVAKQWTRYGGNVSDVIASYNAGTAYKNAAGVYVTKGGNPVVQVYVDKVLNYYRIYQADAGGVPIVSPSAEPPAPAQWSDVGASWQGSAVAEPAADFVWDDWSGWLDAAVLDIETALVPSGGNGAPSWALWGALALAVAGALYFRF